jgi:hypothetical protein
VAEVEAGPDPPAALTAVCDDTDDDGVCDWADDDP